VIKYKRQLDTRNSWYTSLWSNMCNENS